MSWAALEAGGWIGGALAVLTLLGGGVKWLFGRNDQARQTREDKLRAWQEELEAREKRIDEGRTAYVERLEARLGLLEAKDEARDTQMTALRISFELVSSALRHIDPKNSALGLADDLLRTAFPGPAEAPSDMVEQLVAIAKARGEVA